MILVGYTVDNLGKMEAPEGTVALGAGLDIIVRPKDAQRLYIRPEISSEKAPSGVDNKGVIEALQNEVCHAAVK